ncbi:MAG: hypothetical protein IH591_06725, partial [Bacteroidales bacterium]|nr:hypothetical protein [Bacteroidales bacterium]
INGTFIKSFDIKKGKSPLFYMISWIPLTDSLFFGQVPLSAGNEKSKAIIFDIYGNTRREYPNYIILNRSTVNFTSDDSEANFYSYSDTIYYKEKLNDTLFFLTRNYELSSRISFRIGKYKIPVSLRETIDVDGCNPNNYVYVNKIFETSNFLLIGCEFGKYTLHKRITPRIVMGKEIWVNTTDVLGFYSKMNGTLIFCKPSCTDNPIITTGIRNDIDVGPWFYPLKQVNDSTLVMWVEAKQLIDHVESNDFKNDEAMCPEKKKELEVLTNKLSAFDNPILMFVTFHKDDE